MLDGVMRPRMEQRRAARKTLVALQLVLAGVVAATAVPAARANGDPASDYLISRTVFLPFESAVSDTQATQLKNLLEAAKGKGFEVRVALIGSRRDLGAVPMLFDKPQTYADFLGQELVFFYKGHLLVVMPAGYGFYKKGQDLAADKQLLATVRNPGTGDGNALAASAETAIRALAQRRGIVLETASSDKGSSTSRDRVQIVGAVILLSAAAFGTRMLLARRREGPDPA
jgi:hypothetical protein